ncbi:MAG: hypothetical protein AB1510_10860 [Bacillota bacterium]
MAADVGQVPVPEWHKEVLRERLREVYQQRRRKRQKCTELSIRKDL